MSVAACGGGKGGSDDDDKDQITKRLAEVDLGFVMSSNEDEDDDKKEKEITYKTKLFRRRIVLRRTMSIPRRLRMHYPGKSRSILQNLKEVGMSTDAKELRKIKHPFNVKRRRLEIYVESPLSKTARAKNEGQDDVVEDDDKVEKMNEGNDSMNQEDGK